MSSPLDWMGEKRTLIETFMRLLNTYARQYNRVYPLQGTSVSISSAQIQTIEAVFEAAGTINMSEIAAKMGITRGTFSNNITKLESLGLLEKSFGPGNQKDVRLRVSPAGEDLYREYVEFVHREAFNHIFVQLDRLPDEHRTTLLDILDAFTNAFNLDGSEGAA